MNVDYEVKVEHGTDDDQQTIPLNVVTDASISSNAPVQKCTKQWKDYEQSRQCKNKGNKRKMPSEEETMNTLHLLGEPLVSHGPYTFYRALAYRKHDKAKCKKRLLEKQQTQENVNSTESVDFSCCGDNKNSSLCSCNGNLSSHSLLLSHSEWSVVRMNHFYNVRPWYSKNNSSIGKYSSNLKLTSSTSTVADERLHHQQSVCIGELELLWRDDSIATETSSVKKNNCNQAMADKCDNSNSNITKNHNHVDSSYGNGNYDKNATDLQRRRTLPRRTRQPSAKKLEAAESYAAAAAAAMYENHPLKQMSHHRIQSLIDQPVTTNSNTQYTYGNILCSVRLYVMPDQTSIGRLSGVHGDDEVLEINTWNINSSREGSPSNTFINSIYDSDDRINGYRNNSCKTMPSGCSGLVLRVEDFVEWVRGGLMNDEDENLDIKFDYSLREPSKEQNYRQHLKESPLIKNIKDEFIKLNDNENKKIKLCINKEPLIAENLENLKDNNISTKIINSDIEKALESERVPLAAAKIHQYHHFNCTSIENDDNTNTKINKSIVENNGQICYKCSYINIEENKKRKTHVCDSNIKQQLVVMSYSRYCRYRSQLQRRYEKQKIELDSTVLTENDTIASTYQDHFNKTRVLFCRDTYDYPAELLLEPFNIHQNYNQNSNVLVNHMAPKLKGWPAHPASWMSFRWNKVCRRQCRKIKKKCLRQNRTNGTTTTTNSTSEASDSDSDETSLTTNTKIQYEQSNFQLKQSQHNQHNVLVIKPHKLQSLNKLSTRPITSMQSSNTRVIHHHLPPSVTISPVNNLTINTTTCQSEHQLNTLLQNKQIPKSKVSYVALQKKNNSQQILPPVIIEYNDNLEYTSDDNFHYKKSPLTTEIVTCHNYKNFNNQQKMLQADEERQCRWLGDALRLNGLEVTAVPLRTGNKMNENKYGTGVHQQQLPTHDGKFESLLSTSNKYSNNKRYEGRDNLNIEKESVMMTVTPDIVCILNKPVQQQQTQKSFQKNPFDSKLVTLTKQHHRSSKNTNNLSSSSSGGQSYKPVSTISLDTAEALQLKINHSINSLKQPQQQRLKKNNTSIRNNNMLVLNETKYFHVNSDNDSKHHKVQNIDEVGIHQTSLDLSVKTSKQQLSLLPAVSSNLQLNQLRKNKVQFLTTPKSSSTAATNLEITIVPVTTSTSTTKITQQKLHEHSFLTKAYNNSINVFNTMSTASSPKLVRKQIQQNNSPVVITTSASVIDMLCVNGNQEKHVQHSLSIIKTSTNTSTNSTRPQQKLDKYKHTK